MVVIVFMVLMVFVGSDEIEIDLEGETRGLGWLPPHHPLHMEQI